MEQHEILPKPQPESDTSPEKDAPDERAFERQSSQKTETSPQQSAPGAGLLSTATVNDAQQQVQGSLSATNDPDDDTPLSAEDVDLIEKEWVQKAKDIVDATQGDPYIQNQKINSMKAAYIKKRYDKVVKQSEM